MASFYDYSPSNTPPPEYWAAVEYRPPVPPKSERRMSESHTGYQELMPASCVPSVPPRHFTLRPYDAPTYGEDVYPVSAYRVPRKPLPPPPPATPPPVSLAAPLAPPPSLSSPGLMPSSPTLSLRSLASTTSSTSFSAMASPPSRYRHRFADQRTSSAPTGAAAPIAAVPPPPAAPVRPQAPSLQPASPRRALRRTTSPQTADLRALRAKESEACLRAAYESQLNAYLDGSIMLDAFGIAGMGAIDE